MLERREVVKEMCEGITILPPTMAYIEAVIMKFRKLSDSEFAELCVFLKYKRIADNKNTRVKNYDVFGIKEWLNGVKMCNIERNKLYL